MMRGSFCMLLSVLRTGSAAERRSSRFHFRRW
jgi:hypothetical protein